MEDKEEIISFDRAILKNPKIKIYSKSEGDTVKYVISLDSNDEVQTHEERIALARFEEGSPRLLKEQIKKLLALVSEEKVDQADVKFTVNQLGKNSDIKITDELKAILKICSDREKKDLEQISIPRETKIEEIIPDTSMNYKKADKLIPAKEMVELVGIPEEIIEEVGQEAHKRLEVLESIKSEEKAKEHRYSLEAFMEHEEEPSDREKILLGFIEKLDELNPEVIIETLKVIEGGDNKYAKLYPIYLRIQEKRVMKRVQEYLIGLKLKEKVPDGQIEKFLEQLDEQMIEDLESTDLNELILKFSDKENEQIEQYLRTGRKIDFQMLQYINSITDEERPEEKEEVESYLKHRIASVRQVGKLFEKFELREYVEDTSFKDENDAEQNSFLQAVADIEKKHIFEKYGEILNKYNERTNGKPQNLQQYNEKLTKQEKTKEELQELYRGYNELVNGRNGKETGDEGRNGN